MNIVNGWLFTDVATVDPDLQEMGVESEHCWEPFCVRIDQIATMRASVGDDGEIGTTIRLLCGDQITINEPFRNLYEQITMLEPA